MPVVYLRQFNRPWWALADGDPLYFARSYAILDSDYLLVTNPAKVAAFNLKGQVDQVLAAMADLAVWRDGILAFATGPGSRQSVHSR